uniref:Uncharacterized protein n=1 Tax=Anopheles coluzzii TaxID=1518534 RepID=A0A8W7PZ87_ANOCL
MKSRRHTVRERKLAAYIHPVVLVALALRDEIVHIFRHRFVPLATPTSTGLATTTTTILLVQLVRLILQVERFDALARLLQHVRIEREERVETVLRQLRVVLVHGGQLAACIPLQNGVTVGQLVGARNPRESRRHRRQADAQRVQLTGDDRRQLQRLQEREVLRARGEMVGAERDHVEDRLTHRVKHEMRLQRLIVVHRVAPLELMKCSAYDSLKLQM